MYQLLSMGKQEQVRHKKLSDNLASSINLYSTGDVKDLVAGAQQWLPNGYSKCAHIQLNEEG